MKAKPWAQLDFYVFLLVLLVIHHEEVKSEKLKQEEFEEIPPSFRVVAFGRDGHLGSFYNYPDDKVGPSSYSFFRGEIPNWMKQETASRFNWSRSVVIKKEGAKKGDFYDVFKNFETSDNNMITQRLNFLLGFTEVTERGKFLPALTRAYHKTTVMGAVTFAWGTVYEKLEVDWNRNGNSVKDRLQFPVHFKTKDSSSCESRQLLYSHVIMGAQLGAISTIRFLLKLEKDPGFDFDLFAERGRGKTWEEAEEAEEEHQSRRRKEIQGHLEKQMKFLRAKNPEKARELFQKYFKQNPSAPKFQLDIYGDIPVPPSLQMTGSKNEESQTRVKDVYDVLNFIQQVPKLLRKINGGKGWPISFDIVTIKSIVQAAESQGKTIQENGEKNKKTFQPAPQPISL